MRTKRRSQKPIPGHPRDPLPSCVEGLLKEEVDKTAQTFGCSRSWVVAQILCDAFGIKIVERYDKKPPAFKKRA